MKKVDLGNRLKDIRNQKKLTLRDLAKLCDCSPNYLSQVERGLNSPTIETLIKITGALGIKLGDFFSDSPMEESRKVIRRTDRKFVPTNFSGIGYQALTPSEDRALMDAFIITLESGASTGMVSHAQGGHEFLYVLSGRLTLKIDKTVHELFPGDSVRFDSGEPHQIQNSSSAVVEIISVATPPRY